MDKVSIGKSIEVVMKNYFKEKEGKSRCVIHLLELFDIKPKDIPEPLSEENKREIIGS